MTEIFEGLAAGLIQGLTEFLPVSSSGHLVLFGGEEMNLFTEVLLHFATLLAVILVFFRECGEVFLSPFRLPGMITNSGWAAAKKDPNVRMLLLLAVASLPAAAAGLVLHESIEKLLALSRESKVLAVSAALLLTATFLFFSRLAANRTSKKAAPSFPDSLIIGLAQAMAIMPGLSRSGLTISTALYLGISRSMAGTFSFLLSIPAIAGAMFLEIHKLASGGPLHFRPAYHISGFAAALLSGYIALRVLLYLVKQGKLHYFAWYCLALATGGILVSVL